MSFLEKITKAVQRGWTLVLNGKTVEYVESFVLSNPNYGTLEYGFKGGYDRWAFTEKNFGGSVTVPFSKSLKGEILVGLVLENRDNMGGPVWCAPGGFSDGRETHKQTAVREFGEETGMAEVSEFIKLPGVPINPNRAFFVANPEANQGVHAYTFFVSFNQLEPSADQCFKLKDEKLLEGFKKVSALRFIPIELATVLTADALALGAIAKLQVHIRL